MKTGIKVVNAFTAQENELAGDWCVLCDADRDRCDTCDAWDINNRDCKTCDGYKSDERHREGR